MMFELKVSLIMDYLLIFFISEKKKTEKILFYPLVLGRKNIQALRLLSKYREAFFMLSENNKYH